MHLSHTVRVPPFRIYDFTTIYLTSMDMHTVVEASVFLLYANFFPIQCQRLQNVGVAFRAPCMNLKFTHFDFLP